MFNDRKAPRFNNRKYRNNILSKELYKKWKSQNEIDISFLEFKQYWKLIADKFREKIVEERDGVKLPVGLGDMYIGYIPNRPAAINHTLSAQYGKPIKYENWETSGKLAKIIWGTLDRKYIFKMATMWNFTAIRPFKSQVVTALKDNPARYKNTLEKRIPQ